MTVFDVGANIGYYSLQASPLVGSSGSIYSFEPVASTHQELATNISINGITNIKAFKHIVSDHSGMMTMRRGPRDNSGSSHVETGNIPQAEGEPVLAVTLDEFVKANRIDKVDLIKIDVEGYEAAVVKGAEQILKQFKPILLIEVCTRVILRYFKGKEELYSFLNGLGYRPYGILHSGQLRPLQAPEDGKLIAFIYSK
jgi:FkbM family methyltransferase